ncbi:uncharacterized protein PGTG_10298 [Puccinia graminis f. sp. tritici CRL 75-36-700-3]|uniref:Uncharacterized protein n=1 Tax=Puccinia graminis f. sp. tritici (strain CRL 75-36-700-3 / race SCCL) TaxID=418459 RepID=E3KKK2_PUCGT|nr:uncharacterized protein PGTG_10298 [Puccinia graminis f. sp. tritici CRL 75-36-700-3]EFP84827.1 hypothetical protein PGTG_10298 [Puccinia graminis f. sp. tritici CRL 75-36-700-3]
MDQLALAGTQLLFHFILHHNISPTCTHPIPVTSRTRGDPYSKKQRDRPTEFERTKAKQMLCGSSNYLPAHLVGVPGPCDHARYFLLSTRVAPFEQSQSVNQESLLLFCFGVCVVMVLGSS